MIFRAQFLVAFKGCIKQGVQSGPAGAGCALAGACLMILVALHGCIADLGFHAVLKSVPAMGDLA